MTKEKEEAECLFSVVLFSVNIAYGIENLVFVCFSLSRGCTDITISLN